MMSSAQAGWAAEIEGAERFGFGRNWQRFLRRLSPERIASAEASLVEMLGVSSLAGQSFLDLGSGSGLFSLAARRLGARVHSVDYDPDSVACTRALRERFYPADREWTIEQGSVLDADFLAALGRFDVVYCWGVLHHTGAMRQAMENVVACVAPGGRLFVSIYNDQGWRSRYWRLVKRSYNRHPAARAPIVVAHSPYLLAARFVVRALTGRLRHERGMSLWYDMLDWLGGYPFEVAKPEEVLAFFASRGFVSERTHTCGRRSGCNEFVLRYDARIGG